MSSREERVGELLRRAVHCGLVPSAVAAWQYGDETPSYAMAAVEGRPGLPAGEPDRKCLYDLASLTKPLVIGSLYVFARRAGLLELETRVGERIAEANGTPWAMTTVLALLTHTSGLPAWAPLYALSEGDSDRGLESLLHLEAAQPRGEVVYSCLGFILLGEILERAFAKSLDVLFREHVTHPLGIANDLLYLPLDTTADRVVTGASRSEAERTLVAQAGLDPRFIPEVAVGLPDDGNCRFLGSVSGNAGLFGAADGVLRFATQMVPGKSELFSDEEIFEISRLRTGPARASRALAWQLGASENCSAGPALDPAAIGHTGFTGCSLWIDQKSRAGFVLLSNRVHPIHRGTDLHPLRRRFHWLARRDF